MARTSPVSYKTLWCHHFRLNHWKPKKKWKTIFSIIWLITVGWKEKFICFFINILFLKLSGYTFISSIQLQIHIFFSCRLVKKKDLYILVRWAKAAKKFVGTVSNPPLLIKDGALVKTTLTLFTRWRLDEIGIETKKNIYIEIKTSIQIVETK